MEERVKRAIDTLLDAINTNTLAKGTCVACAVGNLVAKGLGKGIYKNSFGGFSCGVNNSAWGILFSTSESDQKFHKGNLNVQEVIRNIEATEFSLKELMKIEYAFETNTNINVLYYPNYSLKEIKLDQIKGLEAVVEVMLSFSNDTKTNIKEVFTDKVLV